MAGPTPRSAPGPGFRLLAAAAVAVTFALITLGGIVRVSESGLGCPDWPLCHGRIVPPFEFHTLIEYSHRLVASLVSLLIVTTAVVTWLRLRAHRSIVLPVTVALGALGMEVVLGGITVLAELPPTIVTVHLLVALSIFGLLLLTLVRSGQASPAVVDTTDPFFRWAVAAALFTLLVTLSGSYLVGAGAAAVCPDWPLCSGFALPSHELTWVHMAHRAVAAVGGALVLWVAWLGWHRREASPAIRRTSLAAAGLVAAQVLAGAANPWFDFAPAAQATHLSLAAALWGSLVVLASLSGRSPAVPAATGEARAGLPRDRRSPTLLQDYVSLTKPPIMLLLLITALGGMVLGAEGIPAFGTALVVLVGGAMASGGASVLNHTMERDLDQMMRRTSTRPVASSRVPVRHALTFGVTLTVLAFLVLWLGANLLSALLAMGGTVLYLLVYTRWLKRSTVQNIVIGGAAGAMPPLVGWAAVTGDLSLPAYYLFAIVFFWTPPHFWALALLIRRDYAAAEIPMLPVVHGEPTTRRSILLYTLVLTAITLMLYPVADRLGYLYLTGAVVLGLLFIGYAVRLLVQGGRKAAAHTYLYSLLYLALLFAVIMTDSAL